MKIRNIEDAKSCLVEAILCEHIGILTNNDNLQDKSIKKAFKIDKFIRANFDLKELKNLLNHDVEAVQIWAANMLLPVYEDIALKLLDDIRKKKLSSVSYNAGMMYDYWIKKK